MVFCRRHRFVPRWYVVGRSAGDIVSMVEVGGVEGQSGGHGIVLLELGAEPQGGGPRHSGGVGVTVGRGRAPQLHRSALHHRLLGGGVKRGASGCPGYQTNLERLLWRPKHYQHSASSEPQ